MSYVTYMPYITHMTYVSHNYINCVGYKNTLHKILI